MTRSLALLVSLALLGPAAARPAAAAVRTARGKVARPARKPAVRSVGERAAKNDKLVASLERKKAKAEQKATREVAGWSERKLAGFGFRPQQRDKAAKVRSSMLFGRNDKRLLTTAKIVGRLLAAEGAAAGAGERAVLQEQQAVLMRSGLLNRKLGTERQFPLQVKRFLQLRFPRLSQRVWFLRRDTAVDPGTVAGNLGAVGDAERTDHLDPVDSTMWKPRKPERVTPEALYAGPWMKPDQRPTLPRRGSVLQLESFRSLDADGIHPSVFVTDPATGTEWKVKFLGGPDNPLSPEPAMSRVYYALGYHASPVYHVKELELDPRAVIAAYQHQQKVGFRVREGSFLARLGLRPGKYGHTAFRMRNQIKNLRFRGKLVTGADAVAVLEQARKDPSLLDHIDFVTVHGVDIALKGEGGLESIGPFHPDDAGNVNRREMRALSIISATWGMGDDVRFNNLRLDADLKDDGSVEIEHVQSDAGAHFLTEKGPNALAWEVAIDLAGQRLHNDQNRITLDAFDRTTLDDARWAARKLGGLSEQQIIAMAAGSAESWPVARLYAEKLMARRDDLVKKLGLEKEVGLLRPDGPDMHMNLSGRGRITLTDAAGARRTVTIPAGNYKVVDGQAVPR